jgi:two-component system KDP operon response regulator KdpE
VTQPLRILVVDDEPPIRRLLRTSFSAHGYEMSEAADAQAAYRMLRAEDPDVMVLDLLSEIFARRR